MIKILFVCHGNICRSPMAEFIMKDMVRKAGAADRFEIDSVAASREEIGSSLYPPAAAELDRQGIPHSRRRARQITQADYDYYDRIYYMDSRNARYLARLMPDPDRKFQPLLPQDVADPWYTGDFGATYRDISQGCQKILKELL